MRNRLSLAAKDHKVGHGGAAQTVCAVHAAGHLTGCKQAGDGGAVSLQHLGGAVDGHAAHGVVHTGGDLDGVEGAVVQGIGKAGTAKVGVVLGLHIAVPCVHGLGKGGGVVDALAAHGIHYNSISASMSLLSLF